MTRPTHHRWDELPADSPMPLLERRRVIGDHAMISHITLRKGFSIQTHAHHNEQFSAVLEGCLRFVVGDPGSPALRTFDVRSGEVIHLPSNVPHAAEALEDTLVLDVFSPPSESTGVDAGR